MTIPWRRVHPDSLDSNLAYAQWLEDDDAIRRTLLTTSAGMTPWYAAQETAANRRAFSGQDLSEMYGDEGFNEYMEHVGLLKEDYWYQIGAAAVKDAVTIFEIYLERSAIFILDRHGWSTKSAGTEQSWRWDQCTAFYEACIAVDFADSAYGLDSIIWIRNKVTHLRNRLRTPAGESEYQGHREQLGLNRPCNDEEKDLNLYSHGYREALSGLANLHLTPLDAWRIMDRLEAIVLENTERLGLIDRGIETTKWLDALSENPDLGSKLKSVVVQRTVPNLWEL